MSDEKSKKDRTEGPKKSTVVVVTVSIVAALLAAFIGGLLLDPSAHHFHAAISEVVERYSVDLPQLDMAEWNVNNYVSGLFESSRRIFESRDFQVGRELAAKGYKPKHPVILLPGLVTTGLESWTTTEEDESFFRQRLWGTSSMFRAIMTDKKKWIRQMTLDPVTGLDGKGIRVRAAEGLDAASYFAAGYWVWNRIIQNLAAVGYDLDMMYLASYDWRLSMSNLEERDHYFSKLKDRFEQNLRIHGAKSVLVTHSMGGTVGYYFLKWVENNAGADWVDKHVEALTLVASTMLGVPKSMAALMTGEMRETVDVPDALERVLEMFLGADERAPLFRSWAGSASLIPKGGETIWGNLTWAPDDFPGTNRTFGSFFDYKTENATESMDLTKSIDWLLEHAPETYRNMLASNYSFGFERDPRKIARNNKDQTKWTNPLETSLPNAPNMKIFCIYGYGLPTERGYYMRHNDQPEQTHRHSRIDTSVVSDEGAYNVTAGCKDGDGDGTVTLVSLGGMCTGGWKQRRYNPGNSPLTVHEILHEPDALDLRGGEKTGQHVDILGSRDVNEAIVKIATGNGDDVGDLFVSPIREYSSRINW
ncbi:phospholipid:diacylglycerol acyltransferase [Malassezia cuniculi]|uniref:Phospholipid:diacylglycerol acyltransferase n=1 Tax=Malassezia cuniculi TaxID=948313 RepID=A0AAF0EP30_9BASI|nr:phospholipid:diacylglycerol acyltransferase [Malassezia cuniculi]